MFLLRSWIPPLPPVAQTFAGIIAGLCRAIAVGAGRNPLAAPLMLLLWPRLNRLARRVTRLAARVAAGTAAPRRPAAPRPPAARPRPPYRRLPRRFAWLVRLVPEAASAGSQLSYLLATEEMAALLAAAPQAGRLLRPLCRTLGVRPPPALAPKPRAAPPPAAPRRAAAPRPSPAPRAAPHPAPQRPRHARRRARRPPAAARRSRRERSRPTHAVIVPVRQRTPPPVRPHSRLHPPRFPAIPRPPVGPPGRR